MSFYNQKPATFIKATEETTEAKAVTEVEGAKATEETAPTKVGHNDGFEKNGGSASTQNNAPPTGFSSDLSAKVSEYISKLPADIQTGIKGLANGLITQDLSAFQSIENVTRFVENAALGDKPEIMDADAVKDEQAQLAQAGHSTGAMAAGHSAAALTNGNISQAAIAAAKLTGAAAGTKQVEDLITNFSKSCGDVTMLAFLVLMEAHSESTKSLQDKMDDVKRNTAMKQELRAIKSKIDTDVARNAAQNSKETDPAKLKKLEFSPTAGMGGIEGYKKVQMPIDDPTSPKGFRLVPTDLTEGVEIKTVDQLKDLSSKIGDKIDQCSSMNEIGTIKLQSAMDQMQKLLSALTNILSKMSQLMSTITQNLAR